MLCENQICIICGDFNIRFQTQSKSFLVDEILKLNFIQLVNASTHRDGGIIDHVYLHRPNRYNEVLISWEAFSPYYSDHYGISISVNKGNCPFLHIPCSIPEDVTEQKGNSGKNKNNKRKNTSTISLPKNRAKK